MAGFSRSMITIYLNCHNSYTKKYESVVLEQSEMFHVKPPEKKKYRNNQHNKRLALAKRVKLRRSKK